VEISAACGYLVELVKRELRERAEARSWPELNATGIVLIPASVSASDFEENIPYSGALTSFTNCNFPGLPEYRANRLSGEALARNGKDVRRPSAPVWNSFSGDRSCDERRHIIRTHDVKATVEALKVADLVAINPLERA